MVVFRPSRRGSHDLDSSLPSPQVSPLLAEEERRLLQFVGGTCGLAFNRWMVQKDADLPSYEERPECNKRTEVDNYNSEGLLKLTDFLGLHECGEGCTSKACAANKQVRPLDEGASWTEG